ncbi:pancreatic lipase-related protein 2 [Stomoxys calcitrans]|uniref:pancreatic lipase-related protein 2 n=1 Tax=Stomoxys calcitrans TaxID=35570 RepID=UPI0027E2FFB5|nr:pancreatic lipase-related protein 2 [Stomoxys calcitrans]
MAPAAATTTMPPKNRDIQLGPCLWAIDRKCPDKDITFYLYTRKNPADRQYIQVDGTLQDSNLTESFFDKNHPSKILIHGYNADMFLHPLYMMKNEYLAKGDYNVFFVDWSKLAIGPCYTSAVHNLRHSGACVAQLVQRIVDTGTTDIHVIGFSLGGQLGNYIANKLDSFLLPRITALDPAMPLFVTSSKQDKLDPSDAEFVDVIHTNALVQGKMERCGHADFYINGGIVQPGCNADNPINPFACSHHRSIDYYLESIRSTKGFWGWACSSYMAYLLGMCPPTNYLLEAGENTKKTTKGMFFVTTNEKSPYAQGKWTDLPTLGVKKPIASQSPPSITIMQPPQRGDPLLKNIDPWGKLDYNFNNFHEHEIGSLYYDHDPYLHNWTYFNDGESTENTNDLNDNSVEEQDMNEYSYVKVENDSEEINQADFPWQEYKRNASEGFIESSLFGLPTLDRG